MAELTELRQEVNSWLGKRNILNEKVWDLSEDILCITNIEMYKRFAARGRTIIIKNADSEFLDWLSKGAKYEYEIKELTEKVNELLTLTKGGTNA